MPYLEIKRIYGQEYAYIRHNNRVQDSFVKVHLVYVGPLSRLIDHASPAYNEAIERIYLKKRRGVEIDAQDKRALGRILRALNRPFERSVVKARATRRYNQRNGLSGLQESVD